jgi:5-formyltetrahydrofolate cyclo-ligase
MNKLPKDINDKKSARKYVKNILKSIDQDLAYKKADNLWFAISRHPKFIHAEVVMAYWSFDHELPSHDFVMDADKIKLIILPRVNDTDIEPVFYKGTSHMFPNKYGIMEPVGPRYPLLDKIELVIVPGLAFDVDGHRLGRGLGYYDRFLSKLPNAYTIGVAFEEQVYEWIPYDENDVKVDELIYF